MSESVLIVDEIASSREELARALDAEGFTVVQSDSTSAAVRDIWENQFLVVYIASVLSDTKSQALSEQLQQMAPEIETIIFAKGDNRSKLARKAASIRDGHVAA
jgi:DNA-binding NtrC family response regulator